MRCHVQFRFLVLLLAVACDDSSSSRGFCHALAEAAVDVELRDADTLAPIGGAVIVISEGTAFTSTMLEGPAGRYRGGFERPGTYRVEVTATGYLAATRSDIVAPPEQCGPVTQHVTIDLQPSGVPVFVLLEAAPDVWTSAPARLIRR